MRQVDRDTGVDEVAPRYLWGMVVGMGTPARNGEVARASTAGSAALVTLALPVALKAFGRPRVPGLPRFFRWMGSGHLDNLRQGLRRLRLHGGVGFSLLCFLGSVGQGALIMRRMGPLWNIGATFLFPAVRASNVVPMTLGGFTLREGAAVFLSRGEAVPGAVAFSSFFPAAILCLVLLVLLGATLHVLSGGGEAPIVSSGASFTERRQSQGEEAARWENFWQKRRERLLGRLISWVRRRVITPFLARFVLDNTEGGTLLEAGCGTGEVTVHVARERGDRVILVDIAPRALMLAKRNAEKAGVIVNAVQCDIARLSSCLGRIPDGSVFNIGVIEHFPDCSGVLREMASVSGRSALAIVPGRSMFWRCFVALSLRLGLVPPDFFVHLYDADELRQATQAAGLEVLAVRGLRILGIIPYLAVRFRDPAGASVGDHHHAQ